MYSLCPGINLSSLAAEVISQRAVSTVPIAFRTLSLTSAPSTLVDQCAKDPKEEGDPQKEGKKERGKERGYRHYKTYQEKNYNKLKRTPPPSYTSSVKTRKFGYPQKHHKRSHQTPPVQMTATATHTHTAEKSDPLECCLSWPFSQSSLPRLFGSSVPSDFFCFTFVPFLKPP